MWIFLPPLCFWCLFGAHLAQFGKHCSSHRNNVVEIPKRSPEPAARHHPLPKTASPAQTRHKKALSLLKFYSTVLTTNDKYTARQYSLQSQTCLKYKYKRLTKKIMQVSIRLQQEKRSNIIAHLRTWPGVKFGKWDVWSPQKRTECSLLWCDSCDQ